MTVGVCIVAAGRRAHLSRALHSLTMQHRAPDQIVVVALDDQPVSAPGIDVEIVRRQVRADEPLPIGAARNLGAAHLTTDALVMLDVDCIAAPDLVDRYDAVLRRHPAALACGAVRYLRRGWQHGADASDTSVLDERSAAPVGRPLPPHGETRIDDVPPRPVLVAQLRRRPAVVGPARRLRRALRRLRRRGHRPRLAGAPSGRAPGLVLRGHRVPPVAPAGATRSRRVPELVANAHLFRERWGRWPMSDWLADLNRRGWVRFDTDAGVLVAT